MIHWDPNPDLFIIPILNWPIKWYGLLFAIGFAIGFPVFRGILLRYFLQRPDYRQTDLLEGHVTLRELQLDMPTACEGVPKNKIEGLKREVRLSGCKWPAKALSRLCLDEKWGEAVWGLKRKALKITDKITFYVVVGTVVGARLGHFFFYEKPSSYLRDPADLFRIWEGGLASHGAAIGIIVALWIFSRWSKKFDPGLNVVRLLDYICVPAAFGGACIRIGNFVNQEVLGTQSNVPWAVVFGHPADGSFPIPRHPVQLYEALFYFAVFFLLWRLSFKPAVLLARGKLIGLFLVLVFGFRFLVEFAKLEQSRFIASSSFLTMGQWLSLPLILAGALLIYFSRPESPN